jgi:hypothetical protein
MSSRSVSNSFKSGNNGDVTVMVLFIYTYRDDRKSQIKAYMLIVGIYLTSTIAFIIQDSQRWYDGICQIGLVLVIPLIGKYNGAAGKKTVVNKWIFYIFYPFHFLVFWLITRT